MKKNPVATVEDEVERGEGEVVADNMLVEAEVGDQVEENPDDEHTNLVHVFSLA